VGHSFGGGAVYSAISEIVTERFVMLLDTKKSSRDYWAFSCPNDS
jgi:hypothetical protein